MFFPDYTIAVQKQHNSFLVVNRCLRELGLAYSLLFPARLRVVAAGTMHFFATPEEAWHWIESRDGGAAHPTWSGLPGGGGSWQSQGGQRRMKTHPGVGPPAVPDLEQRIWERRNAVQRAAALSSVGCCSSPGTPGSVSSDGESSVVTWPSFQSPLDRPDITPQTSDTII
ncbi:hypothetical protein NDU88_004775 [Pleurodeles waltl]|uniref:Uncharacterized protein n=1 Tax=Pleurodeles waltl TaxID=8319 RepID=A0AAV7VLB7_PLEWA|nr:hypothetical protein NDU88_004775 [Pleurodeles waltl]